MTCVLAVVVTFVLKQAFCIVFALIIHSKPPFDQSVSIGIDIQTATAFITLAGSVFSKVGATISGPDIIAAIQFSSMADIIAKRNLDNPEAALSTLLAVQLLSTGLVGLTWLLLVRFRWTRMVSYMPVSVVMGFLGCIGYEVGKEAIRQATGEAWHHPGSWEFWMLLLPVLPIGSGLYFMKRFHVLNPLVVLPLFLFVPVILFYVISEGALGYTLSELRELGWMYHKVNASTFFLEYRSLHPSQVDGGSIAECIPEILILLLIVTIDCLLKLKSTGKELDVEIDMEYEMKLAGAQTLGAMVMMGPPGYSQVKYNVRNYSIIGNIEERRVGIATAILCGILWFSDLPLMDIIPRFFLSSLLLYAALPFFEKNLFASYFHLTKKEFASVWVIVLTNAIAGIWSNQSLLFAILAGIAISFLIFALQSSNIDIIRAEMTGKDYQSLVLRSFVEMHLLDRIGHRFVIIELQHFIFFGSATQLLDLAKALIRDQDPNNLATHVR